jgi:hypothetical protein
MTAYRQRGREERVERGVMRDTNLKAEGRKKTFRL